MVKLQSKSISYSQITEKSIQTSRTKFVHRLLRPSLSFKLLIEKNKLIHTGKFPTVVELDERKPEYQIELKKKVQPTGNLDQMDIDEPKK